eukprot:PhM_4_TR13109/c0_g1_i1/m.65076
MEFAISSWRQLLGRDSSVVDFTKEPTRTWFGSVDMMWRATILPLGDLGFITIVVLHVFHFYFIYRFRHHPQLDLLHANILIALLLSMQTINESLTVYFRYYFAYPIFDSLGAAMGLFLKAPIQVALLIVSARVLVSLVISLSNSPAARMLSQTIWGDARLVVSTPGASMLDKSVQVEAVVARK